MLPSLRKAKGENEEINSLKNSPNPLDVSFTMDAHQVKGGVGLGLDLRPKGINVPPIGFPHDVPDGAVDDLCHKLPQLARSIDIAISSRVYAVVELLKAFSGEQFGRGFNVHNRKASRGKASTNVLSKAASGGRYLRGLRDLPLWPVQIFWNRARGASYA
jgi:hypothetical protein